MSKFLHTLDSVTLIVTEPSSKLRFWVSYLQNNNNKLNIYSFITSHQGEHRTGKP